MATTTGSKRLLNISSEAMAASNSMTYGGLNVATEQFVSTQVSNLISSAPGALDTLNELAAAIGDDANFATTVTNSIATKLDASVNPLKAASVSNDTITFTRADNTTFAITTSDANTDTNYFLNGITRSGNTLTFSVSGTTNRTYTFGSAAWAATTAFDAAGSAGSVNTRIDSEIIPLINGKADASHTHAYLPLAGGTITGSLTVAGSETRGTYTSLSQYHSGADNIVLKGNASGISSIFFESEKDGTNINHPSDFGFIQYHAYGTSTSGESNELIIGVSNDADDHVILNAPNVNGLKFRTGVSETDYTVYHSGNLSLATLGYTGASNANYITNNNQLTNGAGYITSADGGNAQTLDGIDSSSFLRSDANDTATGHYVFSYNSGVTGSSAPSYTQGSIEIFADGPNVPAIGFHRGGQSATSLYEYDGQLYVKPWTTRAQQGLLLSSGNISSYADVAGAADAVNTRIDNEVLPAVAGITLATLGFTGATNANYITNNNQLTNGAGYVTSSGNTIIGTDSDINTSGSTIIDNIYVTDGVITSMGTRVLTLADLGFTGATNANYITNNNQLTNGAGYLTSLPNNAATFTNDIYLSNSDTTVNFIEELTSLGAFQNNYKVFKVAWSYAGNSDLDVGFESVELAGCLIECWGGTYKHVRLTRPTTGAGGRSIYVYNDQGSTYAPGWRQIWTSDEFSSTNVSNWNTAHGWGNHASAGYLTTLGFSYSTGVTGNHVVQRDANGYIFANHINFSSTETENPSINSFFVSNGDGWSRKASVAHVKSQLGLGSAAYVATSTFDAAGSADAVNQRIDDDVLPAIPTNNNQLTNGAGYITGFDITTQTDGKYLRSNADDTFSGALVSNARNNGIFGTYDSTKTDHIWSMGTAYKNSSTGADFGNLYGIAYKHTNNTTGGTMAGGHQAVFVNNGTPGTAISFSGGVWTSNHGDSGNWKQAYDNYITGAAFSGTTTKTLTLTQRDGGTITASFTDAAGSGGDGYLSGLAFNTGNGVLTATVTGGTNLTVDLDGRYEGAGAAATVNDRIDTEVLPAIGAVTLASLGFTGATNANYITNNTQISNGRGYLTSTNDRVYITDSRGAARAPSYYNDRYAQWDFQNTSDTGAGGDSWHALLTVSKWSSYDNSHRQEQLIFTGDNLKRRTATSDSAWGTVKTIWDSGNLDAFVGATVSNDTITFTKANGGTVAVTTSDANTWRPIDDTPVNGVTDQSISSNWAYDHVNASNPHGTSIYDLGTNEAEIVGFIATTMAKQMGWLPAYGSSVESNVQWDDQEEAIKIKNATDTSTGAVYKAVRVKAGDKVRFTVMAKASVNIGSGFYIRLYQYDGDMPDGKTHVSNSAGSSSAFVQEDSRGDTGWYENGSLTTSWKTFERTYTAPVDGYVSLVVLNWDGAGSNVIYVSQPDIQFETNNAFIDASVSNDTITFTKRDGNTVAVTTSDADTNTWRPIHDTPVDGATTTSISSNWAFDNVKTPVPANAVFTDTDTNTTYSTNTAYGTSISGTQIRMNGGEIPSGANLDTYRTQGVFAQNSNSDATNGSNYPEDKAGILCVDDDMYGNGLHTAQTYYIYNSQNVYSRSYYNGSWTAWRNLAQDTNTTYSVGDGGLTQKNFTTALKNKLDGIASSADNYGEWYLSGNADSQDITSGKWVKFAGASSITGAGTETDPYIVDLSGINTDTQYSVGDGGLTQKNFTTARAAIVDSFSRNSVSGNIGIGTTDVQNGKFVISDGGASEIKFVPADATSRTRIQSYSQFYAQYVGAAYDATDHVFRTSNTDRVVIDSNGLFITGVVTASGDITAFSDARVKENIETIDNALDKVTQLRGVEYNKIGSEEKSIGVIAQEVQEVLPEVVREGQDGMLSVAYGNITGVLIEAIKEQQKQIEELKAQLDGLTK